MLRSHDGSIKLGRCACVLGMWHTQPVIKTIMGEIAEDMISGNMCEACGEWIGTNAGIPMYCSLACAKARGADESQVVGEDQEDDEDLEDDYDD